MLPTSFRLFPDFLHVWNQEISFGHLYQQGVDAWSGSHPPTKTLPFHGDMTKGRLCHVPAFISSTWRPAKPRTGSTSYFPLHGFHNLVFLYFILFPSWHGAKPRTLNRISISVRTEIQTGSVRFVRLIYIYFEAGISSLQGTWASAAWVLSISWWVSSSTELSTG